MGRAPAYPRLRDRISQRETAEFVALLRQEAILLADPTQPASRSADPFDDYLLALAASAQAVLVSGDRHLLSLADDLPVESTNSSTNDSTAETESAATS